MTGLSAGGRRLRDRFPMPLAVVALVGQVGAVGAWGFGGDGSAAATLRDDGKVEITYIVTGDRPAANITVGTPNGSEDQNALPLPFKATYTFDDGDYDVSLLAQNPSMSGGGSVTCTVVADGKVVKQASASGDGAVASCGGVAGKDKPLPGATIPPLAAPPLPGGGERLTKVVRVERYPGRGSPVVRRVTDGEARLSYAELGGQWAPSRRTDSLEEGFERTQSFDTDPSRKATIASGLVDVYLMPFYRGPDPGGLHALASAQMDDAVGSAFTDASSGRDVASQPVTVSGRAAWVLVREIRYDKPGVRSRTDLCAVVVVNAGGRYPSFLWVAIPGTHKRLWPDVNTLIASLRAG